MLRLKVIDKTKPCNYPTTLTESRLKKLVLANNIDDASYMGVWDRLKDLCRKLFDLSKKAKLENFWYELHQNLNFPYKTNPDANSVALYSLVIFKRIINNLESSDQQRLTVDVQTGDLSKTIELKLDGKSLISFNGIEHSFCTKNIEKYLANGTISEAFLDNTFTNLNSQAENNVKNLEVTPTGDETSPAVETLQQKEGSRSSRVISNPITPQTEQANQNDTTNTVLAELEGVFSQYGIVNDKLPQILKEVILAKDSDQLVELILQFNQLSVPVAKNEDITDSKESLQPNLFLIMDSKEILLYHSAKRIWSFAHNFKIDGSLRTSLLKQFDESFADRINDAWGASIENRWTYLAFETSEKLRMLNDKLQQINQKCKKKEDKLANDEKIFKLMEEAANDTTHYMPFKFNTCYRETVIQPRHNDEVLRSKIREALAGNRKSLEAYKINQNIELAELAREIAITQHQLEIITTYQPIWEKDNINDKLLKNISYLRGCKDAGLYPVDIDSRINNINCYIEILELGYRLVKESDIAKKQCTIFRVFADNSREIWLEYSIQESNQTLEFSEEDYLLSLQLEEFNTLNQAQ